MNDCPYCMQQTEGEVCIYCGHSIRYEAEHGQLPAGMLLQSEQGTTYRLGAVLGQGGFGITYAAMDLKMMRRVAVKEYYPSHCATRSKLHQVSSMRGQEQSFADGKRSFLDEAMMLSAVGALPSVVTVLDCFEANGTAYLVMEFLDGVPLHGIVTKTGKMPASRLLPMLPELMEDLEVLHKAGVIHRDISPDNLMLMPNGKLKLLDFGSARSFQNDKTMTMLLKAGFSPIEQYRSHGQGSWSDVYALAATIYYCLTGVIPPSSVDRIMEETLRSPNALGAQLPPMQEKVLLHAMEVQVSKRYQSIERFRRGLFPEEAAPNEEHKPEPNRASEAVHTNKPVATIEKAPQAQKTEKRSPKKKLLALCAAVLAASIVLAIILIPGGLEEAISDEDVMIEVQQEIIPQTPEQKVERYGEAPSISAASYHTVALKSDGTVVAVGSEQYGCNDVSDWSDIVAVSAGTRHIVGLKSDGTVVAEGRNDKDQCDVFDWTGMVAISAGGYHTVGLRSDGTVVLAGTYYDVSDWSDIVAISAGEAHIVGLRSDGTVVASGNNAYGRCNVSDWSDIVAISAGGEHTVGLKSDGTVVAVGNNQSGQCDVPRWDGIVAISAGDTHTVAMRSDGTVEAVGNHANGQCNVFAWTDVVAISAGTYYTIGLRSDGTVVATEYAGWEGNDLGQFDVSDWTDIKLPFEQTQMPQPEEPSATVTMEEYDLSGKCGYDAHWGFNEQTGELVIMGSGKMEGYLGEDAPWVDLDVKNVCISGVTSIGEYAFTDSYTLSVVEIGSSVKTIGSSAFMRCENLSTVIMENGVMTIKDRAFDRSGVEEIVLPESLEEIGELAFSECNDLTVLTIPAGVRKIGDGVCSDCDRLTDILVDEENTKYTSVDGVLYTKDMKTLVQCPAGKRETAFTIPDGVTHMGFRAMCGCAYVTSITIPDTLETTDKEVFFWCDDLTTVYYTGTQAQYSAIRDGYDKQLSFGDGVTIYYNQ